MTTSILRLTLLGLLAAAVAAPIQLCAQDAPAPAGEKTEAKPRKSTTPPIHGSLKAVDTTAKTMTVGTHTVQITSETKITKGGKTATLADGAVGEETTVSYKKTDDGKLNATSVRFGPKEDKGEGRKETKKEKREAGKEEM